jgi:hypothetical protein
MASPSTEAMGVAWDVAGLVAAISRSDSWSTASGPLPNCSYRKEALRLVGTIREKLEKIEADLKAEQDRFAQTEGRAGQ